MKRKNVKLEEEWDFKETPYVEAHMPDSPESLEFNIITDELATSQSESADENPLPNNLTKDDVVNIYEDVTKLADIESYLNVLYRPFTCFLNTKCRYNLRNLRLCLPGSIYEPDKHMALVTTHRMPPGSLKVYANGNIYCQAFTRKTACRVLYNFSSALAELGGYIPSLRQPKFNLVNATFCMPFPLDLHAFHARHKPITVYVPKKHPFLTYSVPDSKIKFAIFPVGYVYVMFCTGPYMIRQAIGFMVGMLYRCRASSQQNESNPELSYGDINFKLLWEREFQKDDDFSIQWRSASR